MKHILTKHQVLLLENYVKNNIILEESKARVLWDQSALGILSNAVLRPISWLTGSIKKGIKKQQIDTLVKQWGIEYVNAIKSVDTGEKQQAKEEDTKEEDTITKEEVKQLLKVISEQEQSLIEYKPILKQLLQLNNIDVQDNEYKQIKQALSQISVDYSSILKLNKEVTIPNTEKLEQYITQFQENLKPYLESTDVRDFINNVGGINKVSQHTKNTIHLLEEIEDIFDISKNHFESNEKYRIILENNAYTLPNSITDIFPESYLNEIKSLDKKDEITKAVNTVRLNTIMYEANYIIEQTKESKSDNSVKLQKIWDVGIQNMNDYFQDVINIESVMATVNGRVDGGTKQLIENDQQRLSNLQNMKITETFPVGESFDEKSLYAFDCSIIGQNKKKLTTRILLTPTPKFARDIEGQKYYFFRLFGGYSWDKGNKRTTRINIFQNLTNNQSMINNFKSEDNAYYIGFVDTRPSDKGKNIYLYSDTGKIFHDNTVKEYADVTDFNNFDKIGNIMKISINQRFIIETENIESFPGITQNELTEIKGYKNSVTNHTLLIKKLN